MTSTPLQLKGSELKPKQNIRFLGCIIQNNLGWNKHVAILAGKIRGAATRIRLLGRDLSTKQKTTLYHAWVGGQLMCNAGVYMPRLSKRNLEDLQVAMNAAVRACSGLPRRGKYAISEARVKLGLRDVWQVREEQLLLRAWRNRLEHLGASRVGPRTRASIAGKRTLTQAVDPAVKEEIKAWNRLPEELKRTDMTEKVARRQIKRLAEGLIGWSALMNSHKWERDTFKTLAARLLRRRLSFRRRHKRRRDTTSA